MADLKIISLAGKKEEPTFLNGSLVALKSGSVPMVVVHAFPPTKEEPEYFYACIWHSDIGDSYEASYPESALQPHLEAKPKDPPAKRKTKRTPKLGKDMEIVFTPWKAK